MMKLSRFGGNPHIGVYSVAGESFAFVSPNADKDYVATVTEALGVETHLTSVAGSFVVGSLLAMNSNGIIVSGLAEGSEIKFLSKFLPVGTLTGAHNAAGNNILVNDNGAILNPDVDGRAVKKIERILGVECVKMPIAGLNTVGSACKVTNKGGICPADTTDEEIRMMKDIFKVDIIRTTLNHGSKLLGPCLLANSKGAVVGDITTPIEMGKLEDALNLF